MAKITVTPKAALADEPIAIKAEGLDKNQDVTLESRIYSENGRLFSAYAHYTSNNSGIVDLNVDASLGGDYVGVEPMGLFWAQKIPAHVQRKYSRLKKKDITTPYIATINLHEGHLKESELWEREPVSFTTTERWYINSNVDRIPVRTGRIRGVLFVPKNVGTYPGVIDLRGGGAPLMEFRPCLMACHGFVTLALAYYGMDDLPEDYSTIDMEYFEEAVKFLSDHEKVCRVGVIGISLGGNLALAMAACIPAIACAVNINGPVFSTDAKIVHREKSWEVTNWDEELMKTQDNILYITDAFKLPDAKDVPKYMPEFYLSKASLLFVLGSDDGALKTGEMAAFTEELLQSANKKNYKILFYPGAGHLIEPPYCPVTPITYFSEAYDFPIFYGGKVKEHAKAQEDSWKEILHFLRVNLCDKPVSKL